MTNEARDNIISKIMKLMELGNAEKNSNPHEREAATRMAAKMMADYSIDFAQLRDGKKNPDAFVSMSVDGSEDQKVDFEASLAFHIAKAFDCQMINSFVKTFTGERRYGAWEIHFIGTKNDLEIAVFFFKYLRRSLYALSQKNVTKETVMPTYTRSGQRKIDLKNARRNYCFGMTKVIGERLLELYQKREEFIPSDCKALMVVKKDGLEKKFRELFPDARKGRVTSLKGDTSAYHRGAEAGHKINLSRPIGNNGQASAQIG